MHGLETLDLRPGGSALVMGAGPTGLLLAQLIGSGGATSVTVGDIVPFKLETAAGLGVDSTVSMTKDPAQNIDLLRAASPNGDGYDVVVEATGVTAVGDICVPLTRNGGTVLIYGVTRPDERLSVSPFELFRREITIKGSYAEMTSFAAAIAALRTGRVRTDGIISHKFAPGRLRQSLGDPGLRPHRAQSRHRRSVVGVAGFSGQAAHAIQVDHQDGYAAANREPEVGRRRASMTQASRSLGETLLPQSTVAIDFVAKQILVLYRRWAGPTTAVTRSRRKWRSRKQPSEPERPPLRHS